MKTLEDFRKFFNEQLSVELSAAEAARKSTIMRAFLVGGIIAVLAVLALWGVVKILGAVHLIGAGILVALVFSFLGFMMVRETLRNRNFYNLFKGRVVEGIIRYVDERLHYIPHRYIPSSVLLRSHLFNKPAHSYEGDDYCFMRLENGVFLEFSEAHLKGIVKEEGTKKVIPLFDGIFAHLHVPEARVGEMYILPSGMSEADLYHTGRLHTYTSDSPEFDSQFVVYASTASAVRRYLNSSLIRAFADFRTKYPNRHIYYASHGHNIYLGITAEQYFFEPNVWQSLVDVESLERFFLDLNDTMILLNAVADLSGEPIASQQPQPA
ncbi:MAG: DUF3137 domain-containing protein [Bacteroidia bacterium]|nr:DUF3137 domain-containing protein [Bacteroidia bacterium]MDW8235211.1 DUF3137 domain-containing protein [Bacteroidia bacterium]